MNEVELREHVERIFVEALVRAYQRDTLIGLYHVLRVAWTHLAQPCDRASYLVCLKGVLQDVKKACLHNRQNSLLAEADLYILNEIEEQFARLERQVQVE
jgi:hypothetical protein